MFIFSLNVLLFFSGFNVLPQICYIFPFLLSFQGRIRVVMKCRPKLKAKSKALEVAENMEKIGQICEKMMSRCKLKRSDTSE